MFEDLENENVLDVLGNIIRIFFWSNLSLLATNIILESIKYICIITDNICYLLGFFLLSISLEHIQPNSTRVNLYIQLHL